MATCGGVSCDMIKGGVRGLNPRIDVWTVPGRNGVGAQNLGSQDGSFAFACIKRDTDANIDTWKASLEALQGTLISVTDDHGDTYSNLLCIHVGQLVKRAEIYAGSAGVRGEVNVSGVPTS